MSSPVEQIKARLTIVDIVGSYLKLEKAGINYRGRCPFHNEKTPSFYVSPTRNTYHCFGCGKGGDIFSFVQEIEGLDFIGSLKQLAERAGVELPRTGFEDKRKNDILYKILEDASLFFESNLAGNSNVEKYLTERGLTPESIKKFRLGFARAEWRDLFDHLIKKGYNAADMEAVGLVIKNQGGDQRAGFYDRFRSRVMFPLCDSVGRVVGFSGRIFGSAEDTAKYVNSPATDLYDKSQVLYGYDKAKLDIRKNNYAVLVEGQMDLVLSHQAGVTNAVAVSGTALTDKHLGLIKRLTDNMVIVFDGDLAGMSAARRGINLALSLGLEVKAALLPGGMDPADLVKKDPQLWVEAVRNSKNIIDFYLDVLFSQDLDTRTRNAKVSGELLPYVALLANALDQAHYVKKVSDFLGLPEESVREELNKIKIPGIEPSAQASTLGAGEAEKKKNTANRLDRLAERLWGLYWWQEGANAVVAKSLQAKIVEAVGEGVIKIIEDKLVSEKDRLLLEAEISFSGSEKLEMLSTEIFNDWLTEYLRWELSALTAEIKTAEQKGEHGKIEEILRKCQAITKKIEELKTV